MYCFLGVGGYYDSTVQKVVYCWPLALGVFYGYISGYGKH
jgi:hypothetical protein